MGPFPFPFFFWFSFWIWIWLNSDTSGGLKEKKNTVEKVGASRSLVIDPDSDSHHPPTLVNLPRTLFSTAYRDCFGPFFCSWEEGGVRSLPPPRGQSIRRPYISSCSCSCLRLTYLVFPPSTGIEYRVSSTESLPLGWQSLDSVHRIVC